MRTPAIAAVGVDAISTSVASLEKNASARENFPRYKALLAQALPEPWPSRVGEKQQSRLSEGGL
jgi:hypothetical protein